MTKINTELSLSVPVTNSLAFLFTVLGEWCAEGKVITKGQIALIFFLQGRDLMKCSYMDWDVSRANRHYALCVLEIECLRIRSK